MKSSLPSTSQRSMYSHSRCLSMLYLGLLALCFPFVASQDNIVGINNNNNSNNKAYQICSISGGLDVTRYVSSTVRYFFRSSMEDVELIREALSEGAVYQHEQLLMRQQDEKTDDILQELATSLDWQGRVGAGWTVNDTTVTAGLAYTNDHADRRVDSYISLAEPTADAITGATQASDMLFLQSVRNLLPWLVDRRAATPQDWWVSHQNGRIVEDDASSGSTSASSSSGQAYTAAWIATQNEAILYYPPMRVYGEGHPLTLGDVLGPNYHTHPDTPFVQPNLPAYNPERRASFSKPYHDVAMPGLAMVTAQAPVYYAGSFGHDVTYATDGTYIGSCGVDISMAAVSSHLDVLQDRLTPGSFGLLVDVSDTNLAPLVISQHVVDLLYPRYTGNEEARVTYDPTDGTILQDRRQQPYLPSDTIVQPLLDLPSNDQNQNKDGWATRLHQAIWQARPGQRDYVMLNVTLTTDSSSDAVSDMPTPFYVMFDRWDGALFSNAYNNWTMLVFVPVQELEHAMDVFIRTNPMETSSQDEEKEERAQAAISLEGTIGEVLYGEFAIVNQGNLDVIVSTKPHPSWIDITTATTEVATSNPQNMLLPSGSSLPLRFSLDTEDLKIGTQSFALTFLAKDADYPDCMYTEDLNVQVTLVVLGGECEESSYEMNSDGICKCPSDRIEIWDGNCITVVALIGSILIIFTIILILVVSSVVWHKAKYADASWLIDKSELVYDTPPRQIGQGGFGVVVLAEYRGTQVAVKKLRGAGKSTTSGGRLSPSNRNSTSIRNSTSTKYGGTSSTRGSTLADFRADMRLLSSLRHPNIITVMGAVLPKRKEDPLLVMEYMEHKALSDVLHRSTIELESESILAILKDVSQGLLFLHNTKPQVVHCDLKSHNILIDSMFRAKLSDFGVTYKTESFNGTPLWTAPEVLRQESPCTPASDVYSLGIVLYEIYARKEPFDGEDKDLVIKEICDQKIKRRPQAPSTMPSNISALMHDCLVANPVERPSMNEITSRIARFSAKEVAPERGFRRAADLDDEERHFAELLDKFPRHIAEALRDGREIPPENHECATVLFCDVANFNEISANMPQKKLFDLLHRLYGTIDKLAKEKGVVKVDTSGDAWMGITGASKDQTNNHAKIMAEFAMDVARSASGTLVDAQQPSLGFIQLRLGFHSGPVISNVIGAAQHNPRMALFGDTVNTAARFLTDKDSSPGFALCSESTARLISEQTSELETTPWGRNSKLFLVNEKGKQASAAIERVRAKQKLRLLQQAQEDAQNQAQQNNSTTKAPPESAPMHSKNDRAPLSSTEDWASRTVTFADGENPTQNTTRENRQDDQAFKDLEGNLKDRLGRGK